MAIETWQSPIHDLQDGEVDRERTYLEQFFIFPGNLREFADFMDFVFKKIHCSEQIQTPSKYDKILYEVYGDNFIFEAYDLKKGQAPPYRQLTSWSQGQNCNAAVYYTWKERRTSFRKEVFQDKKEDVKQFVADALMELTEDTLFLARENKNIVEHEILSGTYSSNKSEASSKSQKNNVETLLQLADEDKTKAEVNVTGDLEATVETTPLQRDMETYQKKIIEGKPRKRLEDTLKDEGVL